MQAGFDTAERPSTGGGLLAARLLPFTPAFALLAAIYLFAVNVPYGDDWTLIPFIDRLWNGTLSWMKLLAEPLMLVKFVIGPLALATNFDVTAGMYTGFGFQLMAFTLVWAVLELTLRAWHGQLIKSLPIALAVLMFPVVLDQIWLSGSGSLSWGIANFAAAVIVWLLARWPTNALAFAVCFFISWICMRGLPSGHFLWGIVLASIVMRALTERKVRWQTIVAWVIGTLLLVGTDFGEPVPTTEHSQASLLFAHPLQCLLFVLVYLGWPLVQVANVWISAVAGMAGLLFLIIGSFTTLRDRSDAREILPWLSLSIYPVLAALAAFGSVDQGAAAAFETQYPAGFYFWVGFTVVVALAVRKRWSDKRGAIGLHFAIIILVVAWTISYVLPFIGDYGFARQNNQRTAGLIELYRYGEVIPRLHADTGRAREYLQFLERSGLGPFSQHMSDERQRLQNSVTFVSKVIEGEGSLDGASCAAVFGWTRDSQQPDSSVKVSIYDGDVLLSTIPADRFRQDLFDDHVGNGRYGFVLTTPPALKDGQTHTIRARQLGVNTDLNASPKQLVCQ